MKYILTKTALKSGKFQYQVLDENGLMISQRTSSRDYVACTINGNFYFGRLDLIGKGDHGRHIAICASRNMIPTPIAFLNATPIAFLNGKEA